MRRKRYFEKFKGMGYTDWVLWVDNDIVDKTRLGRAIKRRIGIIDIPEKYGIVYCRQDQAETRLAGGLYSLVIIDCDTEFVEFGYCIHGDSPGRGLVDRIRGDFGNPKKPYSNVPIIFTTADVSEYFWDADESKSKQYKKYLEEKVSEIVSFLDLGWRLPEMIERYAR